jgi:hypothetical protein
MAERRNENKNQKGNWVSSIFSSTCKKKQASLLQNGTEMAKKKKREQKQKTSETLEV